MEYLLENILNMVGFLVGLCIGLASYLGYKNTGSPVLFRMSVAFLSIAIGFFVIWMGYVAEDLILQQGHIDRFVQTLGIAIQTVGYFFIAFSHGVKSFFPKKPCTSLHCPVSTFDIWNAHRTRASFSLVHTLNLWCN